MAITNARMQIKRGNEVDFDAEKMLVGEWALSTDKRIVRICVAPNVCIRMATYDAFEVDMAKVEKILEECQSIEDAVELINSQVSDKLNATIEYTNQAKQYRDEAKAFRDEAEAFAPDGYVELKETVASNTVKIDTIIEKAELNIKNSASGENIHLTDSANGKNVGFGLYGKAEQDGTPTPDNPIEITVSGSDGSVEVVSCGKNFLKYPYYQTSKTENGITFTDNGDGIVTVNGESTARVTFLLKGRNNIYKFQEGTYVVSGCPSGGSDNGYSIRFNKTVNGASSVIKSDYGYGATVTVSNEDSPHSVFIEIASGTKCDNLVFKPLLRRCDENGNPIGDDTYEPYTETTSTIPTPDGLCGIKVSSGGNYTDENGQMWICDEVVKYADGSGKRIQRVLSVDLASVGWERTTSYANPFFYGNIPNKKVGITNGLCTAFVFDNANINASTFGSNAKDNSFAFVHTNMQILIRCDAYSDVESFKTAMQGFKVYYELAEPIITDLSAEEIAEIEKLYTFYPVTNISNDAECGMSITYFADAKNYIDQRLALIESAMLNNI